MKLGRVTQIAAAALMASAGTVAYAQGGGSQMQQPGASQQGGSQPGGQAAPGRGGAGGAVQQQPGAGTGERQAPAGPSGQEIQRRGEQAPEGKAERRTEEPKAKEQGRQQAREKQEGKERRGAGGGAGLRPELSQEQRTNIRQHLSGGPHVEDLGVSIAVGTRLPRRVEMRPLPPTVIEIVPQYRGYDYFLVGDQIVIVDPDTLEIVAVLPA